MIFSFVVKDYQLIQSQDSTRSGPSRQTEGCKNTLLSLYLNNFTSIISHLLQVSQDNTSPNAVEASWVLSLALKGLYNTLKVDRSFYFKQYVTISKTQQNVYIR